MDKYQRFVEHVMSVYRKEVAKEPQADAPQSPIESFRFGYLHGMVIRLIEELKQQKEESAALKDRLERLEAKLNQ